VNSELLEKLLALGFSINEAKVYAAIIKYSHTNVKEISNATGIHPQDIYKVLPKLEEKGLILRTYDKPCIIEPIPAEIGMKRLVASITHQFEAKIENIKNHYTEIVKILNSSKYMDSIDKMEKSHVFIVDKPQFSKVDLAFKNLKSEYDLVLPNGPFEWLNYMGKQFKILAKRKAKICILILSMEENGTLADAFANIMPKTANFEIKTLKCPVKMFFVLIDKREVWIPIPSTGKAVSLVTNAPEVVLILRQLFEKMWNDPKTKNRYHNLVVNHGCG
jgi:sugar-specific transcriptional regulator TrmB